MSLTVIAVIAVVLGVIALYVFFKLALKRRNPYVDDITEEADQ